MKSKLFVILSAISLILLIGTAGASDAENITLSQTIIQSTLLLILFVGFGKIAEICSRREK